MGEPATLLADCLRFGPRLDAGFHEKLERARSIPSAEARQAYYTIGLCRMKLDRLFAARSLDMLLTPSAAGRAPGGGLQDTGLSVFSTIWTAHDK